ncbi:unnamed protein product [Ceutorhynchus assimilis]|uniref:DUF7869 domain-containing protein n=1 Tax=Ceutorhynchus assimilis TaxID=467358 RepID=A0A9N9QJR7_9CUCU|nr:unnamed protein product [Ceutorhynchus assimilis]
MGSRGKLMLALLKEKEMTESVIVKEKISVFIEKSNLKKTDSVTLNECDFQPSTSSAPTTKLDFFDGNPDVTKHSFVTEFTHYGLSPENQSDETDSEPFIESEEEYIPNDNEYSSSSNPNSDIEELTIRPKINKPPKNTPPLNEDLTETDTAPDNKVINLGTQANGRKRKGKYFPPKEKISKKKKCEPDTWKKRKAALARSKGESYLSYKNIPVPEKQIKEELLCREKCRLNCSTRFTREDRMILLKEFYSLDINSKNTLLFKSIHKHDVKRVRKDSRKHKSASYTYYVTLHGNIEKVCKEALCSLYQIGRKKIDIIKSRLNSGASAPPPDQRGRHLNRPHKIDDEVKQHVIAHINKFPAEMSHYSRNRNPNKKYLSPLLNLSKMYQLYLEECDQEKLPEKFRVKKSSYSKLFVTKFNLSFGSPKSDTCSICDTGESKEEHKENYIAAINALKMDREKAKTLDNIVYITIDMQQTMPLPKITTSKAFYLRQMWFYNFGIHVVTKTLENASFCTWTEDIANRESSETCSSLLYYIEIDETLRDKNHLLIWSDSCAGQNKNFSMVCLYQYLILKGYFRCIDHKFPEVGHTYLDSDRDFGRIEKVLRKHDTVYVPETYRDIIVKASKKNKVIDMTQHFRNITALPDNLRLINRKKDELNETVRFRDGIKWIRVEEYGSYLYKESYDETVPFKKVNILKNKKITEPPQNVEIQRVREKYGTISDEKKKEPQRSTKIYKTRISLLLRADIGIIIILL